MLKQHLSILLIGLLGTTVGLLFVYLGPDFPISSDFMEVYHPAAQALVEGRGFGDYEGSPNIKAPPVFPIFVAIVYYFGGGIKEFAALQSFFLAGIGIFAYLLAKEYLPKKIAFAGAIMIMLWPYFVLYTKLVYTEVIFMFFFLLALYFLTSFTKNATYSSAIGAGVFLAIATLTRAIAFFLPIWIFLMYLFVRKEVIKEEFSWRKWSVLLISFILVMSPWLVRNYVHYDTFVVAEGLGGVLNKSYVRYDYTHESLPIPASEVTIEKHVTSRLQNIYLFWNPGAAGDYADRLQERFPQASFLMHVYRTLFIVLVGLAFASLMFVWRNKHIFLLWSTILYFWTVHVFLFPYPRYTLPVIPLVIILAWFVIQKALERPNPDAPEKVSMRISSR